MRLGARSFCSAAGAEGQRDCCWLRRPYRDAKRDNTIQIRALEEQLKVGWMVVVGGRWGVGSRMQMERPSAGLAPKPLAA